MADKSLQKRSMRKAVARVDVGVFGIPMRYAAWMRAKRSSWSGLIAISAGQAVAGMLIALVAGYALGVPMNAFSLTLLVCFAIGSAIGGPIPFLAWSLLLIGVTGLLAGFIGGAWVASPSWWRSLAAAWSSGKSVPSWFLIAVPGWILLWVGGSYGISKLIDRIYDAMSLSISFKAATRFSSEEQRIHAEAFAESNVSAVESRSLIDNGSDGTEAIIAGKPQVVEPGVRLAKDVELGGEPDLPPPAYGSLLEEDMDDPDVRRAMGLSAAPVTEATLDAPQQAKSTAFVIERDEPSSSPTPSVALPQELSEDLPAVPTDAGAPLRRVTPPKVDALASRAMSKKLQQLLTSFEMALYEDKDEDFIRTNQDELALISEEQKAMLRAMDNSGPLLSAISAVQRERASEFLMGRSAPPVAEGTGTIPQLTEEFADVSDSVISPAVPVAIEDSVASVVASMEDDSGDAAETGQVVIADSVAAMGSIFSSMVRRTRVPIAPDNVTEAGDLDIVEDDSIDGDADMVADTTGVRDDVSEESPDQSNEAFAFDPAPTPSVQVPVADAMTAGTRPVVRAPDVVNGFVIPRPPGERPVETPVSDPVTVVVVEPRSAVEPTVETAHVEAAAVEDVADEDSSTDHAGEISSVSADGTVVVFEVDIEEPTQPEAETIDAIDPAMSGASDVSDDANDDGDDAAAEEDDKMSSLVFSRRVCREVIGLITGSLAPSEKAKDVLDYERDTGVSVAQILNSRSFDEYVGSTEAVAARHTWMDVQRILSQSSVERLVSDFERLNARGQSMVEEPHTLTPGAFLAFESECTKMLTAASVSDDTISASLILMERNREILEALRDLRDRRDAAALQPVAGSASTVVRQKIPAGEDVEATRGRGMLASVLGGARRGRDLLRSGDVQPASETIIEHVEETQDDVAPFVEPVSSDLEEATVATRVPAYGDEDYVSKHAVGTSDYDFDMEMHGHALTARRRIAAQAQEKAEREENERLEKIQREENERLETVQREERERQEKADREERDRLAKLDQDERDRQRVADEARETERKRLLEGDEAFIQAERQRAIAAARESSERAEAAAAEAAAARAKAERETRENERSAEDQRVLTEHRAKMDGNSLPVRFRERDIPMRFARLTDLRDQRKKFQTMSVADKIVGLNDVPEAIASPAKRSSMMMDVLAGVEAAAIYETILAVLEPENSEDIEFVRNMVPEGEERRFVVSIQGAISSGKSSENALKEADAKLLEMRHAVTSLEGVSGIVQDLERVTEDLAKAAEREADLRAQLVTTSSGSEAVVAERDRFKRELEALTRKVSGIVDDDFQRLLEKYAKPIVDAPFQGVFLMTSRNRSNIVIIVTTTPEALPGGVVRVGDRSMTLTEVVQIMFDNVKTYATDTMDAYFTTTNLQSMANGGSFTTSFSDRSVNSFVEMASIVDMKIEPADLQKGE